MASLCNHPHLDDELIQVLGPDEREILSKTLSYATDLPFREPSGIDICRDKGSCTSYRTKGICAVASVEGTVSTHSGGLEQRHTLSMHQVKVIAVVMRNIRSIIWMDVHLRAFVGWQLVEDCQILGVL